MSKYELGYEQWSTYHTFKETHNHIIEELVDAGIAELRDTPIWMDIDGDEVLEDNVFGCKVTHDILHPDYFLVMDDVSGNLNQKCNGNVCGQFQICERGTTPQ